ncbi:MAG: TetR/AcrR family transcriptional regulator [Bradymonadia bacterium]
MSPHKTPEHSPTREAILDAATVAFVKGGYRGTTMQQIAEAAGYTVPTLYSHFKNKQAILDQLMQRIITESFAVFDAPVPSGLSLSQHLELLHLRIYTWLEENNAAIRLLSTLPEAVQDETMNAERLFVDRMITLFGEHPDRGAIGDLDPALAAWTLWGIGAGVFMRWLHHTPNTPLVEMAGYTVRVFFNGIRGEIE